MDVGEPVVGWVDHVWLRQHAARELRTSAVASAGAVLAVAMPLSDPKIGERFASILPVVAILLALVALNAGWTSALSFRGARESWGVLHARCDGDAVELERPGHLSWRRGKRFRQGESVTLTVAHRSIKVHEVSDWTIAGSSGTVKFSIGRGSPEERWTELVAGLERVGLTVAA